MNDGIRVSRRRLPGLDFSVSSVAIELDPPAAASAESESRAVGSIRRAWERGVTVYDLARTRSPIRAAQWLAEAFPEPQPELTVLLRADDVAETGEGGSTPRKPIPRAGREPSRPDSWRETARRIPLERPPILVGGPFTAGALPSAAPTENFDSLRERGEISGWALAFSPGAPSLPDGATPPVATLFAGPLSLLERRAGAELEERHRRHPLALLANDPFAGGLLDGSRISASIGERTPGAGPPQLRALEQAYSPILRLGFLTADHRRTLADAALQYVLHWPWVATVSVPLPVPERLDRVLSFEASPPLRADELERIDLLGPLVPPT